MGAQIAHLEHVFQQEITHQKEFWNTIKVNSANASPQICLECDMLLYPNTFREEGRSILTPKLMMHYGSPAFLKTIQYSSPLVSTLNLPTFGQRYHALDLECLKLKKQLIEIESLKRNALHSIEQESQERSSKSLIMRFVHTAALLETQLRERETTPMHFAIPLTQKALAPMLLGVALGLTLFSLLHSVIRFFLYAIAALFRRSP